jgi:hypothetical protein
MNSKVGFLAASAWQQIFGLRSRLAIQQWSLAPDTKICAASLPKLQLLNSFVYTSHRGAKERSLRGLTLKSQSA